MVIETPTSPQLLIADDNRSFRETLRELLEPTLVQVHEVDSGEEAVEYSKEIRIDIVLLDLHMHVMTGLEALRMLKQLNAVRPCILITSDDSSEVRRDALEADAYTVLGKPVFRRELCKTVTKALEEAYNGPASL